MTRMVPVRLLLVVGCALSYAVAVEARSPDPPNIIQVDGAPQYPGAADAGLSTASSIDTFTFGPYGFETGWSGWTSVDFTLDPEVYVHRADQVETEGFRSAKKIVLAR